jgi:hypothetical protein
MKQAITFAFAAMPCCLNRIQNLTLAVVGQAFMSLPTTAVLGKLKTTP